MLYLLSPFQKRQISTFSILLKCKVQHGEIFSSPGCSAEAVNSLLCTRLVCGIHIHDIKGSSSRRTKVECASRIVRGATKKQGAALVLQMRDK